MRRSRTLGHCLILTACMAMAMAGPVWALPTPGPSAIPIPPLQPPPGMPDPTLLVTAVVVYGGTAAAKALGLPDATVVVRAFALFLAALIPFAMAWATGTLVQVDYNHLVPVLWQAAGGLTTAAGAYLAATGLNSHAPDKPKTP